MSPFTGVHWQSPTVMLLSLLSGFSLILGHHLFYVSLDRKAVSTASYSIAGRNLSPQQLNLSVGTAFALLVKICLAVAVSTAYVQIFWRSTRTAEPPTLDELDLAHGALENIISFCNRKFLWRYPSLVLLGLLFWCIPVATIFPPATLSVANAPKNITSMLKVPQYDFTTLNFVAPMDSTDGGDGMTDGLTTQMSLWAWSGPSQPLQNIAIGAMALGQILPIAAPAPNASWTLEFWGPLLQCKDVIGIERDQIWTNIKDSYDYQDTKPYDTDPYAFLSWTPWPALVMIDPVSGQRTNTSERDLPFQYNRLAISSSPWQFSTGGPASLFVAVQPETLRPQITASTHNDSTLLRCDLLNSSYSMDLNYVNGIQDIQVSTNTTGISPLVIGSDYFIGPTHWPLPASSNCTSFLVNPYSDSKGNPPLCIFDVSAMRLLSYQGIMTAFNQLILGDIRFHHDYVNTNTTILKTVLAQTDELSFFRNWHPPDDSTKEYLQTTISNMTGDSYPGLLNRSLPRIRADLKTTLEQLFQNFTVSLLSEPYFQPNYSSPFAPSELTNVSLKTYHNIYTYDRTTLWIAYGIPLFFATLVTVAGMFAILLSGASYSSNFSTIVRVSRTAKISVDVADQDGSGCDPLPKYLEKARLDLGVNTATTNTYEFVKTGTEEQDVDLVPKISKIRSNTRMTI